VNCSYPGDIVYGICASLFDSTRINVLSRATVCLLFQHKNFCLGRLSKYVEMSDFFIIS
jgi:hypothetical protein